MKIDLYVTSGGGEKYYLWARRPKENPSPTRFLALVEPSDGVVDIVDHISEDATSANTAALPS